MAVISQVVYAASKHFTMPVIGTMGPRTQDLARMGHEMIKSCLGAYRHAVDEALPEADDEALGDLVGVRLSKSKMSKVFNPKDDIGCSADIFSEDQYKLWSNNITISNKINVFPQPRDNNFAMCSKASCYQACQTVT